MTTGEFKDKQFNISITAGMNQRYHQLQADWYARLDRGVRITVGLLAVAGASLAVVTTYSTESRLETLSIVDNIHNHLPSTR